MIQGTATIWAMVATAIVLVIDLVYITICLFILYVIAWGLGWIWKPLIRISKYGR